jgi:osmotically-inducible protein OsmY
MNRRHLRIYFLATIALITLSFSGCLRLAVEAGKKAAEDRTTEDQVTDTKIDTGIMSDLYDKDAGLVLDVKSDVWEQRVMLTGTLDDPQVKSDVVKLVKADSRVKAVYDEIQIVTPEEKEVRRKQEEANKNRKEDSEGMGQAVDDFWISTKIKGELIAQRGVTWVHYRWRSVKNHVYIIGRAEDEKELNLVLENIRGVDGVVGVKHFIEVKPYED